MATLERGPNERNNMANNDMSLKSRIAREEEELKRMMEQELEESDNEDEQEEGEQEIQEPVVKSEGEEEDEADEVDSDEDLSDEEKTFKKRYGDLRRKSQEDSKKFKEQIDSLKEQVDALKSQSIADPAKVSEEDVNAWIKKYPQIAGVVDTIAAKKAKELFEGDVSAVKKTMADINREKGELEIKKTHADYDKLKDSDDFHDWAEEQPKWVQDSLYSQASDPRSVIQVINLYKMEKGLDTATKKRKELEAASAVKTKKKADEPDSKQMDKKLKESEIAAMGIDEYARREAEIEEARRKNNIIYDISGRG